MSIEYKLPDLGEGVDEGQVSAILVSVGDEIGEGDSLIELETGKSAIEVPSEFDGKIVSINVKEGDTIKPGDLLVVMDGEATGSSEPAPAVEESTPAAEPEAVAEPEPVVESVPAVVESSEFEYALPDLGEGVEEGQVTEIYVSAGDEVGEDDALFELEHVLP